MTQQEALAVLEKKCGSLKKRGTYTDGKLTSLSLAHLVPPEGLPPEIGGLEHLEELSVAHNFLPEVPPEIGKLEHLKDLDLSGNHTGATQQYLYCSSNHPHQLTGLYPTGTTCSGLSGATYTSSYDNWGNVISRTYNGTTAILSYDILDQLTTWNAGSSSQEWYAYGASGNCVLRRSTTSSETSITTYAFGLEEHVYDATENNTSNTFYYTLAGRLIGAATGTAMLSTQFFLTDLLSSVLTAFSATAGSAAVPGNQLYGP